MFKFDTLMIQIIIHVIYLIKITHLLYTLLKLFFIILQGLQIKVVYNLLLQIAFLPKLILIFQQFFFIIYYNNAFQVIILLDYYL